MTTNAEQNSEFFLPQSFLHPFPHGRARPLPCRGDAARGHSPNSGTARDKQNTASGAHLPTSRTRPMKAGRTFCNDPGSRRARSSTFFFFLIFASKARSSAAYSSQASSHSQYFLAPFASASTTSRVACSEDGEIKIFARVRRPPRRRSRPCSTAWRCRPCPHAVDGANVAAHLLRALDLVHPAFSLTGDSKPSRWAGK